jgi:hypothetical protein
MNGIPTTFNDGLPAYTVVGGGERCGPRGMSAVLLCHPKQADRDALYRSLAQAGFEQVLSIEERGIASGIDHLSTAYPFVRFILLNERLPAGSKINLAATELQGNYFFVLGKDCRIDSFEVRADRGWTQNLCAVPLIFGQNGASLPVRPTVTFSKRILRTKQTVPAAGARNLFPFEGIGVYNRELFIRLGGYDNSIPDEYWQFMDFGLRAYAWGEKILSTDAIRLTRSADFASPPIFIGESYRRFYLKNLSPVYHLDAAHLPLRRFPFFLFKSGIPLPDAWEEFAMARAWVTKNAYRWKCDMRTVIKNWDDAS